jgi:hypothetical protein
VRKLFELAVLLVFTLAYYFTMPDRPTEHLPFLILVTPLAGWGMGSLIAWAENKLFGG